MINKNNLRKAISSIAISNAKRNTIYRAFSDLDSITKEEFDSVKSDISKVIESMLTKDAVGKANGVASLDSDGNVPIEQLSNIDTTLFLIVRKLPTNNIQSNKIYLVTNQNGQGNNVYLEYLYVEGVWEKLGEFKAEVDLSEYAKAADVNKAIEAEKTNREVSIKEVNDKISQYPGFKIDELGCIVSPYKVEKLRQNHIIKKYGAEGYSYIVNVDLSLSSEEMFNFYVYNSNNNIWNKINKYKVKTLTYDDNAVFAYIDGTNLDTTHKLYFDYSKTDNPNIEELYLIHDIITLEDNKYFCKIDCNYDFDEISGFIYDVNNKTWYDANFLASMNFTLFNCETPIDNVSNVTIYNGKGEYDYTPQSGSDVIAIGKFAFGAENGIAIGNYSNANVESNIAIGNGATIQGDGCIALGSEAQIKDYQSGAVAIGSSVCVDKNSIMKIGKYNCDWISVDYPNENIFIKGIGGFDGNNLTVDDSLNKNIKPLKDVIDSKADTSAIPTKLSQLINDSNFITTYTETDPVWNSEKGNYYTKTEIDNKGYLTEHQSLKYYVRYSNYDDSIITLYGKSGTAILDPTSLFLESKKRLNKILINNDHIELIKSVVDGYNIVPNYYTELRPDSFSMQYYTATDDYDSSIPFIKLYYNGTDDKPEPCIEIFGLVFDESTINNIYNKSKLRELSNITAATTAEEVVTKFNALLADLKAKRYMEADTTE